MDKTTIRTIARGNPCVLLLKGGTILRKTAPSQLPDETQLTQPLDQLDYGQPEVYRPRHRLGFIAMLYVIPMLFLLLTEKTVAMIIGRVKLWRLNRIRRRRKAEHEALKAAEAKAAGASPQPEEAAPAAESDSPGSEPKNENEKQNEIQ